jgi:hypothetical protein
MRVRTASRNATAILTHRLTSRAYHRLWRQYKLHNIFGLFNKFGIEIATKTYNGILLSFVGSLTALSVDRLWRRIVG